MKSMLKTMAVCAALLSVVLCMFASCGGEQNNSIVGVWKGEDFIIEFAEDGTCYHNGASDSRYTLDGDTLTLESNGQSTEATVQISGDTLSMTNESGMSLQMTRISPNGGDSAALIGCWESTNGGATATMEFTADGKVYTQGMLYADYKAVGDTIVVTRIFNSDHNFELYTYQVSGDTLELTANGETMVCTRAD